MNKTPNSMDMERKVAEIRRLRQDITNVIGDAEHLIVRLKQLEDEVATKQMAQLDAEKSPEQHEIEAKEFAQLRENCIRFKHGKTCSQWKQLKKNMLLKQLDQITCAEDDEQKMEEEITFLQLQKVLDEL